jgi:hypothetical protein
MAHYAAINTMNQRVYKQELDLHLFDHQDEMSLCHSADAVNISSSFL